MAFSDYNFGGLQERVWVRLQKQPRYSDPLLRGLAVNKGIEQLSLFLRTRTLVLEADPQLLGTGQYAMEYPMETGTLWVDGVTFGIEKLEAMTLAEYMETGFTDSKAVGRPHYYFIEYRNDGSKVLCLFPRPQSGNHKIRVWGGMQPTPLVDLTDPLPFASVYADPVEYYACYYLLAGQIEDAERAQFFMGLYEKARDEAKLNFQLDRKIKIQRTRDYT